jgi:SNF2 family DNA or RNA helicase
MQHSFARRALDRHRCNECGSYYTDAKKCQKSLQKFSGAYDGITGSTDGDGVSVSITGKGKKAKTQSWLTMRGEVLPSSKTIAVKSQILNWIEQDPNVKIIVYSQFIPMLNVLGRICQTEGWGFEKYTGGMSHDSRDRAIKSFGDPTKDKRILLASLKCGGLGLNLTMANCVICLEPCKFLQQLLHKIVL